VRAKPPRPFRVCAVLFDFDETLTGPGAIDFELIRRRVGCPPDTPILEYIADLAELADRERALAAVHEVEIEAAARSHPNEGAEELIRWLHQAELPIGIQTRNSRASVERALANFHGVTAADFDVIITRDDPVPHKPEPDGMIQAAYRMGVKPAELLVIGDYVFDIEAGRRAGAVTVLLDNHDSQTPDGLPDFVVDRLAALPDVIQLGRPLPAGKVPAGLLEDFLEELPHDDPSVLVPPRVGEDITVVDAAPGTLISLGADPVTFSAESPGAWALVVNANDIAVCGADPRWFLATVLLPLGSTPSQVVTLLSGLAEACAAHSITLCGGHTEITDAVTRPVVAGTMLGTFGERGLVDKRTVRTGDVVLLTKRIAVEGTALLAAELSVKLREAGMTDAELARCVALRDRLSVLEEARIAAETRGVRAMHDVTEGGLATAVAELAVAAGHSIGVDRDAVPYYEETLRVCDLLGADPLGLIGSGSLLICCAPDEAAGLLGRLAEAGVEATALGAVLDPGRDILAWHGAATPAAAEAGGHPPADWPTFAVDEVARVLESGAGACSC
jgi:hydrogenase expression/formation protein HypE